MKIKVNRIAEQKINRGIQREFDSLKPPKVSQTLM